MAKNDNYLKLINRKLLKLTEWIIDHRIITLVFCLLLAAGSAILSSNLHIDNSMEAYFNADDPSFAAYNTFMDEYGNDEFLYILYTTQAGISDLNTLKKVRDLTEDLEDVPFVKRVHAVTNIEFIEGDESGDVIIYDLMEDFPENQDDADRLVEKLLDKPLYVNSYITQDKNYAAILCEMQDRPEDEPNYRMIVGAALKEVLAKAEYRDFTFWPVGNPVLDSEFYFIFKKESRFRPIITYLIFIVLLAWFFRQVKGVVGPISVVVFSVLLVIGFVGLMDFPVTAMFGATPSLLIAIGVATSVHIINEYRTHIQMGHDNRTSILSAVRLVGMPCLFTALTTTVGFASLLISPISATRDFGWYTIFGVMANLLFCFSILFVVLSVAGKRTESALYVNPQKKKISTQPERRLMDGILKKIAIINMQHYRVILIVVALISIAAVWGITRLEINSSYLEEYGPRVKTYHDYKFVDKIMGGAENFEILLDSKTPDGVKTLQFVQTLEKIQTFADSQDYLVSKTVSIIDIIKDINRSLHNNDKAYYKLPASNEAVSQYILLYEASGGEELEKMVSADIAAARLTIYAKSSDSKTSQRLYNDLVSNIESIIPKDYTYHITGMSFLVLKAMQYIEETQISSLTIALIVISLLMVVVFRSLKVGLISMLPNIFPIIITLGIMGWTGIWLDYVRTLISCIAIGLAVDDTIHFMARYQLEFNHLKNYEKALFATMRDVGRAITITTIVLVVGFSVSMTSQLNDSFYFGLLSSICIILALLADYFLCPALILMFKPFGKELDAG